ncbi:MULTISPECIES: hypothetical protein [Cedecea]|jgi:hypothetical protein|uniref:hypothetical protein n=1 Tax=Cedecea TaxID=158483 RepID=UPI001185152B|nr:MULTISPECIES: hypothetical protein [Cedecea]NWC65284.1 hypothetical protein [Cedecea sp. P7760]
MLNLNFSHATAPGSTATSALYNIGHSVPSGTACKKSPRFYISYGNSQGKTLVYTQRPKNDKPMKNLDFTVD